MTRVRSILASARTVRLVLAAGLAFVLAATMLTASDASSHREAPLIMEDPVADNTDVYAFRDPHNTDTVNLISNFVPFQEAGGGPNYFRFGEDVLYEIHVDNDGDAVEDVTYEFRFENAIQNGDTYLYATGPIESLGDSNYNFRQTMDVHEVRDGTRTTVAQDLLLPPENIGPRATPDYAELAAQGVHEVGDKKLFAGQRDDGFYVDIASIFDVGGLRPFNDAHAIPLDNEDGVDTFAGYNVHSIALQVPIDQLTAGGEDVIGVWSTASRRQQRVFTDGNSANPTTSGPWTQVSRLGNPLINEVVVPLEFKDTFNTLEPQQDADVFPTLSAPNAIGDGSTQGPIPLVTDPILAEQIKALYGIDVPAPPRNDLVNVFLKGVEGLNRPADVRPAEILRLNTAIEPVAPGDEGYSKLGVIGGDNAGFPNGRRPGDDVTDIALRVVAGELVQDTPPLSDGVQNNDVAYLDGFPYLGTPHQGYELENPRRVPPFFPFGDDGAPGDDPGFPFGEEGAPGDRPGFPFGDEGSSG